jgi:branched-chain amino acid transport system substrate-binding protein
LTELSKKHGFTLSEIPVDHPGQEQKSQWLQIRREKPDYVIMYGWGVMNAVAIQEAANINFPMDHFIGVWWSGSENDVLPAGAGANGYKSLTMHGTGMDYPVYADIKAKVLDAGKASGAGDQVGSVLYSRGMYAALVISEAIRKAQEIHGTAAINAQQLRDGFEALEITEARMAELGLPHFGQPFKASCADHGGPGAAMIQQWDATAKKWTLLTDFIAPDDEVLAPLIAEDSAAYAAENNIAPRCN